MDLFADILLIAGGCGAGIYCLVLSRRLSRFNDLEKGMGGAVAVLSAQVDDLTKALETARRTAETTSTDLADATRRAEETARRLELLMVSTHGDAERGKPDSAPSGRTVRRRRRHASAEEEAA